MDDELDTTRIATCVPNIGILIFVKEVIYFEVLSSYDFDDYGPGSGRMCSR